MSQNSATMNATQEDDAVYHRDTCRLCAGKDLDVVMKFPPTPVADSYLPAERKGEPQPLYAMDLYLCRQCGLVHLCDVVDPKLLYRNYIYRTTTSPGLVEHFRTYSENVMSRINPSKGAFVVEVGSNDGTLLRYFAERGMNVLGVDPAQDIAERATRSGVETMPDFFTPDLSGQIKQKRGAADIIIANNVMANIDNLDEFVKSVKNLLAPNGVFVFETGYLIDSVGHMVFDNVYHEHLCYLSVKPLETFFKKHGMELIRVDRVPTKGGSIRGTVQIAGGPRPLDPSVAELVSLEERLGMSQPKAYQAFAEKIDQEKEKLLNLLKDLKAEGKTIAGYGASHSVTTFLHYFGIGEFLDFIVDDNVHKHNTLSPGHQIPVFPSDEIYERKPDCIVILAWRFYKHIIDRHSKFLNGGQFIIPLPKLEVIKK